MIFFRWVGHAGKVTIAVQRNGRGLAVRTDDAGEVAVAIAIDCRDVAVAIGDRSQLTGWVVGELMRHRSGERMISAQMAADGAELVKLTAVRRRDVDIAGGEPRHGRTDLADLGPIADVQTAVRGQRDISSNIEAGF